MRINKMNKGKIKITITVITMVSVLAIWFALPNTAQAKTITIGGADLYYSLGGSASSVTATVSFTQGSGSLNVSVTGYAYNIADPEITKRISNSARCSIPSGTSASIGETGYRFYSANAAYAYDITLGGNNYKGTTSDSLNF